MNFPKIQWSEFNAGVNNASNKVQGKVLSEFMSEYFLFQTLNQPTRLNNILDVIITNNTSLIAVNNVKVNVLLSDHNTIVTKLNLMIFHTSYLLQWKHFFDKGI